MGKVGTPRQEVIRLGHPPGPRAEVRPAPLCLLGKDQVGAG